jgi:hypothetical protein
MLEVHESAHVIDVSNAGALIESPLAVAVDSLQSVRLTVEGREVAMDARVRHLRRVDREGAARYLVGLEFLSPPITFVQSVDHLGQQSREL